MRTLKIDASSDAVQVALILGVAIFLTLSQSLCFGLASFFWPQRACAAAALPLAPPVPVESAAPVALEVTRKEPPKLSIVREEEKDDDALVDALKVDVERIQASQGQVQQFLADCTYSDPEARIPASELYSEYEAWAQQTGREILTSNRFGRICTSLHVARDLSDRRRAVYMGIEIIRGRASAAYADAA